jgi:rhodanese-related sulfurtransferase
MATAIDRDEVQRLINGRAHIVDVLPRKEYDYFHLPGAIHVPLKSINKDTVKNLQRELPVIVYCHDNQ